MYVCMCLYLNYGCYRNETSADDISGLNVSGLSCCIYVCMYVNALTSLQSVCIECMYIYLCMYLSIYFLYMYF